MTSLNICSFKARQHMSSIVLFFSLERDGYVKYQVEPRLPFDDGRGRWADFLIEANGETWYWEQCGRLDDEQYRRRWNRKLKLYADNGFTTYSRYTRCCGQIM